MEICEDDVNGSVDKVLKALHEFIDENPPSWQVAKAKAQAEGLDWVN